jgi:hypothetical protein
VEEVWVVRPPCAPLPVPDPFRAVRGVGMRLGDQCNPTTFVRSRVVTTGCVLQGSALIFPISVGALWGEHHGHHPVWGALGGLGVGVGVLVLYILAIAIRDLIKKTQK